MEPEVTTRQSHKRCATHWVIGAALGLMLALTAYLVAPLRIYRMDSPSMEPRIKQGALVVATTSFDALALRDGDLVVVQFSAKGPRVQTIRMIERGPTVASSGPGDAGVTEARARELFYVSALSTNALDSRLLGPLQRTQIRGKVIRVL